METSIAEGHVKKYHESLQAFLRKAVQEEEEDTKAPQWARDKCREWYDTQNDTDTIKASVHCLVYTSIREAYKSIGSFPEHFHQMLDWGVQKWSDWNKDSHQLMLQDRRWKQLFTRALVFKRCLVSQCESGQHGVPCVEMTREKTEEKMKTACYEWQKICCFVGCGTSVEWNRWDTFKYCKKHIHFLFVRLIRHVEDVVHRRPEVAGSGLFDLYLNVYAFPTGTTFDDEHICQHRYIGAKRQFDQVTGRYTPAHIGLTASRLTRHRLRDKPCQQYGKHPHKDVALSPVTLPPVSQFEYLRPDSDSSTDDAEGAYPLIDTAPRRQVVRNKRGKRRGGSWPPPGVVLAPNMSTSGVEQAPSVSSTRPRYRETGHGQGGRRERLKQELSRRHEREKETYKREVEEDRRRKEAAYKRALEELEEEHLRENAALKREIEEGEKAYKRASEEKEEIEREIEELKREIEEDERRKEAAYKRASEELELELEHTKGW